jgi:hypothetical protein
MYATLQQIIMSGFYAFQIFSTVRAKWLRGEIEKLFKDFWTIGILQENNDTLRS